MNLVEDDSLDFEYEVNENEATGYIEIYCKMFDTEFFIAPLGGGPFYEDLLLTSFCSAYLDPEVLCIEFNSRHKFASAVPLTIESNDGSDEARRRRHGQTSRSNHKTMGGHADARRTAV
jgi:hypothetical protein